MRIGEIFRYPRKKDPTISTIDGLPNYFYYTHTEGEKKALLEKGINPIGIVKTNSEQRTPAILISSSPHKIGSSDTPWQDYFDIDNGHIRYFGDSKDSLTEPNLKTGNNALRCLALT